MKYMSHNYNYPPKSIIEDISNDYGIEVNYQKAWWCREQSLMYIRGSVEMSYKKIPYYLHMLDQKNSGTVMPLETNEIGQFKYFFMALSVSICRFKLTCHLVLYVDGSFLKYKCGRHMLVAITLDANNHLYLVAFTVMES